MKKRTVLFGAGPGAKRYIEKNRESCDFVAILDNDANKHETVFCGVSVYQPSKLADIAFDEVVITTQWVDAVKKQLTEDLHICDSLIVVPNKKQLKDELPFYNPSSRALGRQIIKGINELARSVDIPLVIDFGTLLGIVRDNDIIEWDDDIDFAISYEYAEQTEFILQAYIRSRPDIDWEIERVTDVDNRVTSLQLKFIDPKQQCIPFITSIAMRKNDNGKSIHLPSLGMWYSPQKHFDSYELLEWQGQQLQVPNDYLAYLTFQYGEWKTPKKDISYSDYANLQEVCFDEVKSANWKTQVVNSSDPKLKTSE